MPARACCNAGLQKAQEMNVEADRVVWGCEERRKFNQIYIYIYIYFQQRYNSWMGEGKEGLYVQYTVCVSQNTEGTSHPISTFA
jgi:beta-mannanase